MEYISLASFEDVCMKWYQSVEEEKHSTTPYNAQYIQSMWVQKWFPPSINRLCQEIALEGRYSDFYEWMDVTLDSVQDALSLLESVEYPGHLDFSQKVQEMKRGRVAHVWSRAIKKENSTDTFSTALVLWSCRRVHIWSSRVKVSCSMILIF